MSETFDPVDAGAVARVRHGWARAGALLLACLPPLLVGHSASASTPTSVQAPAAARAPVTAYHDPPHLHQWWYDALRLRKAHRISAGKGVTIAVIDGFVDTSVPDLRGADIQLRRGCRDTPGRPQHRGPGTDHGTGMTTLLVGQGTGNGPRGRGILGVAPEATVRFYSKETDPDPFIECDTVETADVMLRAARQGADIISYSGGGGLGFERVMPEILRRGVLVVAAAGERVDQYSPLDYPAQIPGVVAVNAADAHARPWPGNPFSAIKYGFPVVTAPGVDVPVGGLVDGRWVSGLAHTGTSPATAIAAGIFALMKSRWPDATAAQLIQNAIHAPGDGPMIRWDSRYGFGTISATYSLPVDPTGWPDENPLLHGPHRAVRDYPMSSYHKPTKPSSAPSSAAARSSPTARTPAHQDQQGGAPVWAWVAGGLAVLALLAAAGYAAARRRAQPPPSRTTPQEVDDDRSERARTAQGTELPARTDPGRG